MRVMTTRHVRQRCLVVVILVGLLFCTLGSFPSAQAASWSWSFSSSNTEDDEAVKEDESVLVSPLVNRQLETSVKAHHWPTTPQSVFCEALAFYQKDDDDDNNGNNAFAFLDRLVTVLENSSSNDDKAPDVTWKSARDTVRQATAESSSAGLFQVALALRSGSPLCETHRQLARQAWLQHGGGGGGGTPRSLSGNVLGVVYPARRLLTAADLSTLDWNSMVAASDSNEDAASPSSWDDYLLPDECPPTYSDDNDNTTLSSFKNGPLLILYANLGTPDFVRTYRHLEAQRVPFVVRHLGAVNYEENGASSLATPTTLQGYGVRVDIRNVEYKVFDDRRDDAAKMQGSGAVNLTAHPETAASDFLAGVDVQALGLSDEIKVQLWQAHEHQQAQSQKVPPVWQRRQLPMQAATVISQAEDPLATLTQVSQNLPSLASLLVNVKIPEEISQVAELLEKDRSLTPGRLYVNGRKVLLDSPSFNVFEILNVIRQEEESLRKLQDTLSPYFELEALKLIQDAWMQGEAFDAKDNADDADDPSMGAMPPTDKAIRIDVGRGWKNAIVYLNDVEKDSQYAQWPRSVMSMIQGMQYGMPPIVRRNMYTILAVIDPVENPGVNVFQLGMQLIQSSYPARVGVLWASQQDIDECRAWLQSQTSLEDGVPCPTKPIFDSAPSNKDLTSIKATTQAAHRLLIQVVEEFEDQPEFGLAYCEYFLSTIEENLQTVGDLNIKDLIDTYAGLMQALGISADESSASEEARDALMEPTPKYGHGLRFAAEKNLRPGMGFLNGRPLDGSDTDAISRAFGAEQQHIFGLIMKKEITDTAPKSVYAKLLSGDKVFKKVHPLLFGKEGDTSGHLLLNHSFGPQSLLFPPTTEQEPKALFVVESFLPYSAKAGLGELKDFLNALNDFPTTVETSDGKAQISVGYRILPASTEDAKSPLCPILASASHFGVNGLVALIDRFEGSGSAMSLEQLLAEGTASTDTSICTSLAYLSDSWVPRKMIVLNGRSYEPDNGFVTGEDLNLLFDMEWPRARAVYEGLKYFSPSDIAAAVDAFGKVSAYLGAARGEAFQRTNIIKDILGVENRGSIVENPLRFRIPAAPSHQDKLESAVAVVLDPVSDAAQRISTLLELFNEHLGMPIDVILSPALLIDGDSKVPITSYYRFVADAGVVDPADPVARFSNLPTNHILTIRMDVPEPWDVQQTRAVQDTDNLRCDVVAGCSDASYESNDSITSAGVQLTSVEYGLSHLLFFGQCYETTGTPPNGLQLTLTPYSQSTKAAKTTQIEIDMDGTTSTGEPADESKPARFSDTLVMKTVGYWQLLANAGVWNIQIAEDSKGASMFDFVDASLSAGRIKVNKGSASSGKKIVMKDFVNRGDMLFMQRRPGLEKESLFYDIEKKDLHSSANETINVFSLATGHLYERFLKIMMLSVTKRTSTKVKFWLFENFLSPTFKATAKAMAKRIGCEVEFVTYKWPEWLRNQSEKQRIIWGYKILFLDVLFPLDVKKIIYVDADQVVRGDMKELWDMDLQGAPYGYTPFCSSRESTLGYQFWREGFWKSHLKGKPYHISALYVVDLETFRRTLVGDQLRATYQQLSADPNSLANLDQDLPNYAQSMVPIFSLPQEWLWCESWCSDETKAAAKTIDLCNNPMHKEPKVSMAKRVISGPLFEESWVELDEEVERYEKEYFAAIATE